MELSTYFEPIDSAIVDFHSREFRPMLGDEVVAYTEKGRFPEVGDTHLPAYSTLTLNVFNNAMDNNCHSFE